jgi:3-isopropylmalate dehydrogenase
METGQLWRSVASEVGREFPDVELTHLYADNCAMQLLRAPSRFDVIVADNLFGDILSDEAAALCGSLGLLPSATLRLAGEGRPANALYEPIHGSAPDIAGRGIANPLACILSFGMCLRYSLDAAHASERLGQAIRQVLARGLRTPDIAREGEQTVTGAAMTDAILDALEDHAGDARREMRA